MNSLDRPTASGDCPTVATLQAFCQGKLAVIEIESISEHVQRCERCASILLDWSTSEAGAIPELDIVPETRAHEDSELAGGPSRTDKGSTDEPPTSSYRAGEDFPECIDRYRIVRVIGRGGFGKVFLARDEQLERLVAVKVPHPERLRTPSDVAAFRREASLHANVDHPHIVPIYDVGGSAKTPFFAVSKFVPGMDLAEVLRRGKPDRPTAARWVASLADALEHLHNQRLVHRDVKPRNVMIDALGQPLLMDFGLAKRQVDGSSGNVPVAGTPGYMSPEQARGDQAALDGRSDIYSLGVLFYELLTGTRPFRGGATSIFNQIQTVDPPSPRDADSSVPRDLAAICLKAMARDRDKRYQRASDFAEDLRRYLGRQPPRFARKVPTWERAWSLTRRHPAVTALTGLTGLAVVAAGFAFLQPRPGGPQIPVFLQTEPPGADLYFFPLHETTRLPDPKKRQHTKGGAPIPLAPGYHLVVAVLPDGRFHEVWRLVPEDPTIDPEYHRHNLYSLKGEIVHLSSINIPQEDVAVGMSRIPETPSFTMGSAGASHVPVHQRRIPAFYLDPVEVSVAEYRRQNPNFDYLPTLGFPDGFRPPPENYPITCVSWDDAVEYAESQGKRLPDEAEFEYVATLGKHEFPAKDAKFPWNLVACGEPASDRVSIPGQPSIFGMNSNVVEWTATWASPYPSQRGIERDILHRVVRGGPLAAARGQVDVHEPSWTARERFFEDCHFKQTGLGFRCARSAKPRVRPEELVTILP